MPCATLLNALIVEAAVEAGADTPYTEGLQAGSGYRGITVVDPFVGWP